ncbi:hypothetical protein E4U54_006964 [Claviceps lovelessii]|nr:hypothetical protein E4U54_006964 [Claviceps lovelessii]
MATTSSHDSRGPRLAMRLRSVKRKLQQRLLPLRMYLGRKIMYVEQRKIVQISRTQLVKGPCSEQELQAMLYAASHTSVPVPRIHRIYRLRQGLFIAMDYIHGESLQHVWPRLTDAEKAQTIRQVWDSLNLLHACRPPSSLGPITAASIGGGPVRDGALHLGECGPQDMGPFLSAADFATVVADRQCVAGFALEPAEVAFVHADICPRNIIRGYDGKLWLIDWEFAGWWPTCK